MFDRRSFLTAAAAATILPGVARAQTADVAVDPYAPRYVAIQSGYEPYSIHVDPATFSLFWVLPGNEAILYKVGIAREGLYEPGVYTVGRKAEWPRWTPTAAMISREPEIYAKWSGGMAGGPDNPLGSRALYLYDGGRDTYLRIHGTPDPQTIGTQVSNGCVRLMNDHVADLYDRVPSGTTVYLYPQDMA